MDSRPWPAESPLISQKDFERIFKDPVLPTLVVNLFGGPGTGKSTTAALVFGELKTKGVKVELVHEFAKDLTWEERDIALGWQPYIFGKQSYHIHRLLGKTDVIITDSPILLSSHIYSRANAGYNQDDLEYLGEGVYKAWNTLSIFLRRDVEFHPFESAGRNQDEVESKALDTRIIRMLAALDISYTNVNVSDAPRIIVEEIMEKIS